MKLARRAPEVRQGRVLAEATRLFAERGYENTSVNEVAKEAGVSVGALYKYFPDKPALLEAVLAAFEDEFVTAMRQAREAPGSHFERLERMVHGLFELASQRDHFFWALTSGTHGLRGARPSTPGARIREEIARFLESGIAAGEFRAVDPEQVAALGFGVVETAMRHCFAQGSPGTHRGRWETSVHEMLASNVRPSSIK
jgi:AcrR family transcriptional regulator